MIYGARGGRPNNRTSFRFKTDGFNDNLSLTSSEAKIEGLDRWGHGDCEEGLLSVELS